jgi:hypothetical protein
MGEHLLGIAFHNSLTVNGLVAGDEEHCLATVVVHDH